MKIAMLTYSVKPRGGVVHALEVSEALARRGHRVELIALARDDEELYRSPAVPLHVVRQVPTDAPFDERVQVMLATYADGLRPLLAAGERRHGGSLTKLSPRGHRAESNSGEDGDRCLGYRIFQFEPKVGSVPVL